MTSKPLPDQGESTFRFDRAWVWRRRDDGETGVRFTDPANDGVMAGFASEYVEVMPASERDRLREAEKLALQLKDEAERCVKDLLAENETLQAERDLLLADATRLADGLRDRGIIPGRNPDGVNDDAEKALVLYDDAMAEVKRLRRLIGEAYTARSPQPYMAIRKLFRETNLTPASDEIGETT